MTRIVCCQLAPAVGELQRNVAMASEAVRGAVARGADIVVLPELVTSGYCFSSPQEASSVAIRADDDVLTGWASVAGKAVVVGGFAELGADGTLYNSAALVDATGIRAVYRKTHLWDRERFFFTPGDDPAPVIATDHGRIGMMICYDLEFPEMTRAVALRGADVLAVPTNWPWSERPPGQAAAEVVIAMAAARVNRMAIACCDRCGIERGQRWNEASTIIGCDGWPAAVVGHEGLVVADLDPELSRDKRISENNDVHRDRRPIVYH